MPTRPAPWAPPGGHSSRRSIRCRCMWRGRRRGRSRVHQKKAAGSVGVFRLTGCKAILPEQGRLLVARAPGNGNGYAVYVGIKITITGRHDAGKHGPGNVENSEQVIVPRAGMDVEKAGSGSVGDVGYVVGVFGGVMPAAQIP